MAYHNMARVEDEERLLESMLQVQSEIRKQREEKRRSNNWRREKFTRMFEPVTSSIARLAQVPQPPPPPPVPAPEPVKDEEEEEEEDKFYDTVKEPEEESEIFRQALDEVPEAYRSDGVLGLDVTTRTIGNYAYQVKGDTLHCLSGDDEAIFQIKTLELLLLLLVKNPNRIELKLKQAKEFLPFVYDFKDIADRLQLEATGQHLPGFHARKKYKILRELEKAGTGFLFTHAPPTTNTVVLPSDKEGLIQQLVLAVAELRAGNTSMQNLIVPLAAEAKRLGCLPEYLLSPEEETWVFA